MSHSHRSLALVLLTLLAAQVCGQQDREEDRRRRNDPFDRFFDIRGVEFSEAQQKELAEIRKEYAPQLVELRRKLDGIITEEQRQARREAFQAAREAGKRGRELREAAEDAVELTDEQQKELDAVRGQHRELVSRIQQQVRGVLTEEQRRELPRRNSRGRGPGREPTHGNVKYGPHERNVMDVWLAEGARPTPVLVSVHGGGFRNGNKSVDRWLLEECLDNGISVVAITYRLSHQAIAPAQFYDSARAVQFIRHSAKEWNVDPERIASTGSSAGAGLSLWLGFHDDLADADSDDPVLRESSRLTCMSVYNGQTSYDPRFIRQLFPGSNTYQHEALAQLYDVDLDKLDDLPEEKYRLFEATSPIAHLSENDVPAMLCYGANLNTRIRNQGVGIHHPRFGQALKERMDKLDIECQVHTNKGRDEWVRLTVPFVKKHFGLDQK